MNIIQFHREKLHLTQTELADKADLSLRTIQRLEAGNVPKGHTLKQIAKALEVSTETILAKKTVKNNVLNELKKTNLSCLTFLLIPYGNLIFPYVLYSKNKTSEYRKVAKQIINLQICWVILASVLLIFAFLLNKTFNTTFPFFILFLVIIFLTNLIIIFKNANQLDKNQQLYFYSPINFL